MHAISVLIATAALAAAGIAWPAVPAGAVCSVFDRHPCLPTVCSVFQRRPCIPQYDPPIGQDLRLTIASAGQDAAPDPPRDSSDGAEEHKVNTIADLFAALRTCWIPPAEDEARPGMQMSVRFAFKRTGEIIGTPRVTYTSPDAPRETRDLYHQAIKAALDRCTPMPFTNGLGGAVAGRPIAIRFVDDRPPAR